MIVCRARRGRRAFFAMKPSRPSWRHASTSSAGVASRMGAVCHAGPVRPRVREDAGPLVLGASDEPLVVEPQDVEGDEHRRHFGEKLGGRLGDVHSALEALEAGLAFVVEGDDFAVEDRGVGRQARRPGRPAPGSC